MKTITRRESAQADAFHSIPTSYNGLRFRSRLEARTAIVMDCLGIPYQYEPEGFQMGSVRYLPDFYLPEQDAYLEIKPPGLTGDKATKACIKAGIVAQGTGKSVFLRIGDCGNKIDGVRIIPRKEWEPGDGSWECEAETGGLYDGVLYQYDFFHCVWCDRASLSGQKPPFCIHGRKCWFCGTDDDEFEGHVEGAYIIARRVRFDHPAWRAFTPAFYRDIRSGISIESGRVRDGQAEPFLRWADSIEDAEAQS